VSDQQARVKICPQIVGRKNKLGNNSYTTFSFSFTDRPTFSISM